MRRRKTTPNKSLKLLNNARGQLDAVIRLIHDDAAHVDILKQILATISLLRRSHTEILKKYASYAFKVPIPITQPGVGANAFAHASGIHADGVIKDRKNYELYDYEELGRGEPELIVTGRQIVVGEYSGIRGFRNVYDNLEVEFKNEEEARKILELTRFANVEKQKPLVEEELLFIASYPEQARKILTLTP
jgi:isopropylmalate/homocitrate/citramalate synthase